MKGSNLSNIKNILHGFHNSFYLVLTIVIKLTHNQLHLYLHMLKFVSLCTLPELIPTIYGLRSKKSTGRIQTEVWSRVYKASVLSSHSTP